MLNEALLALNVLTSINYSKLRCQDFGFLIWIYLFKLKFSNKKRSCISATERV
jgi:hypothetical protein